MLRAATATMPPTIIRITLWSILKAPNLEPKNPPIITTTNNGRRSSKLIVFVIACPAKPLIELVRMKKLAVAAARFGTVKRDNIKRGDSHIPPPIPTSPATEPKTDPIGAPMMVSFLVLMLWLLICCCLFLMV